MTIKKTTLGFMAITFLIGATESQAETLTVRAYNHSTDKHAVRALIKNDINRFAKDAALIKDLTQNEKKELEKDRKELATVFFIDLFDLKVKYFDGEHFSRFVLESDKGIQGYLLFGTNNDDNCDHYDSCDCDYNIGSIFLKKEYLNYSSFQKLLNEVIRCTKKFKCATKERTLQLSHIELAYSKEYKSMFEKCGFILDDSSTDLDGILTFNEYKMIIQ